MDPRFAHIRDWIFDLDNCLYPASTGLFALIDERMGAYIQRLLDCDPPRRAVCRRAHFHEHGTTLAGLMKEHGVDPHDFLEDVHDIPLDRVAARRTAGAAPVAPSRPQVRLHQRRRALCPAGARSDRRRIAISTSFTTSMPANLRPKPDPHGYQAAVRAVRHRPGPRAARRRHGAESRAGQGARNDHGVGRQRLRARRARLMTKPSSTCASTDVGEWLETVLGEAE